MRLFCLYCWVLHNFLLPCFLLFSPKVVNTGRKKPNQIKIMYSQGRLIVLPLVTVILSYCMFSVRCICWFFFFKLYCWLSLFSYYFYSWIWMHKQMPRYVCLLHIVAQWTCAIIAALLSTYVQLLALPRSHRDEVFDSHLFYMILM